MRPPSAHSSSAAWQASELDAIIVCTVTPDYFFPSTACLVQNGIGARGAWGFDLIAACSGFVYGLTTGAHLVAAGTHRKVLVIGADTMSRIVDYTDRATCILFGDAAGAMLIEPTGYGEEDLGFIDFIGEVDGSGGDFLKMPAGGSRLPASHETVDQAPALSSFRMATRSSSTPSARCTNPAAICCNVTASPATTWPW